MGGHRVLDVTLEPGDLLLAYSDGAVDAQSPEGDFFGEDRLVQILEDAPAEPQEVVDHLVREIAAFTGGQMPYDDVTLVAASWSDPC